MSSCSREIPDFAERRYRSLSDTIELPALGILLPLSEIYLDTGLE